jgi:hypothetical protein
MTETGAGTTQGYSDDVKAALQRVDALLIENPEASQEEMNQLLSGVDNYEAIHLDVRQAVEALTLQERRAVRRLLPALANNRIIDLGGFAWF